MSPPESPAQPLVSPGAKLVLEAARALFAEQGIDAVSMQDIATRAGVSKANVFHHFASKEALYIEVLRACMPDDGGTAITALIASAAPFEERLLALLRAQLRDMLENPCGTRLVIREVTNGNAERARRIATEIFAGKIRQRMAFFEDAAARGELRAGMEPHLCDMLLGACCMFHFNCGEVSQHLATELGTGGPLDADTYAQRVCAVLAHGFCPDASARPGSTSLRGGKAVSPRRTTHTNRHPGATESTGAIAAKRTVAARPAAAERAAAKPAVRPTPAAPTAAAATSSKPISSRRPHPP